jgi:ATP-dependent 26S proteasome regulatory subunit
MLWGPPGSGKTVLCQQLSSQIVNNGGISVYLSEPRFTAEGLRVLRLIEPKRPIVVMIEDIDAIVERNGESNLLALLDGELQIDNVVFVATTNYPEKLDKRLVNRPSRFDEIIKIGMPSPAARAQYLSYKVPRLADPENADELQQWVDGTKEFSIAHLREAIISVECLGNELNKVINRLVKMNNIKLSSESTGHKVGFTGGFDGLDD